MWQAISRLVTGWCHWHSCCVCLLASRLSRRSTSSSPQCCSCKGLEEKALRLGLAQQEGSSLCGTQPLPSLCAQKCTVYIDLEWESDQFWHTERNNNEFPININTWTHRFPKNTRCYTYKAGGLIHTESNFLQYVRMTDFSPSCLLGNRSSEQC